MVCFLLPLLVDNSVTRVAAEQVGVAGSPKETENHRLDDSDEESKSQPGFAQNESAVGDLPENAGVATNLCGGSGQENLEMSPTSPELGGLASVKSSDRGNDDCDSNESEQGKSDDSSRESEYTTLDTLGSDGTDDDDLSRLFRGKSSEPLRVGDEVEFSHPLWVQGNLDGKRVATVKSITSACADFPISLANGDVLSRHQHVRRTRVIDELGELSEHRGVYRMIKEFRMKKSGKNQLLVGVMNGEYADAIHFCCALS